VLAYDFDRLQSALLARFGSSQEKTLKRLNTTLEDARGLDEEDKLVRINDLFNRYIRFEADQDIWGEEDYWATPLETIGKGRGDCEDIAIAKYFSLTTAGVPVNKLRLVYVRATVKHFSGPVQQAHMVLAYYPAPNAEPLILDNLVARIRPAGQRRDLLPIFSFNSEAIWSGVSASASKDPGSRQMTRWQDLQQRTRTEGFE